MRRRLGLDLKTAPRFRRRVLAAQHHLDAHDALRALLARLVHDAHSASAEFFNDFIIVKLFWYTAVRCR